MLKELWFHSLITNNTNFADFFIAFNDSFANECWMNHSAMLERITCGTIWNGVISSLKPKHELLKRKENAITFTVFLVILPKYCRRRRMQNQKILGLTAEITIIFEMQKLCRRLHKYAKPFNCGWSSVHKYDKLVPTLRTSALDKSPKMSPEAELNPANYPTILLAQSSQLP